jgi:hypothetical protein
MRHYVFVRAIKKTEQGPVVVEASNGGPDGPPFARFELAYGKETADCHVGKRYRLTIEEAP